jgi:acyl phosphate:glycerol-3-phosphate acyltransferase
MLLSLLIIAAAYLVGSISSASIIGHLFGHVDMTKEPDGRISASALYFKRGRIPFLLTVILDICLALSVVIIAKILTGSTNVMMMTGFATVCGHNWSIWLKFKGGLGATAIGGVLFAIVPWQFFYALILAGTVFLFTRRPGLSTVVGLVTTSAIITIQTGFGLLAMYPIILFLLMLLKRYQTSRANTWTINHNNAKSIDPESLRSERSRLPNSKL